MHKMVAALVLMLGACWNPPEVSGIERVTEPAREVPVAHDVDVVVAGGGISGVFAALGAAHGGRARRTRRGGAARHRCASTAAGTAGRRFLPWRLGAARRTRAERETAA